MPRTFRVKVNGEVFDVEVEEVRAAGAPVVQPIAQVAPAPAAQAPAPRPAAAPAAAPVKARPVPAGQGSITAPMPGTILDVKVAPGASVKRGTVVMILEAMKMQNEIVAPVDGTVKEIAVGKGATVNPGDLLAVIG